MDGGVSLCTAERWMGGHGEKSLVLPSALGWGTCEGLPFAWGGAERGSPMCRCTLPMLTEPAAGRADPALGSLPGMGFLGEVPAGKGRSLNRWGRPIAFLEGSSSDSPMRPPPKWALRLAQTFLSGHSEPRHCWRAHTCKVPGRKTGVRGLGVMFWPQLSLGESHGL